MAGSADVIGPGRVAVVTGAASGALGPYGISKHAIVALSETLYF